MMLGRAAIAMVLVALVQPIDDHHAPVLGAATALDSLRVKIEVRPSSVSPRDTATVTVTVVNQQGAVMNALVNLSASGGLFRTGERETSGVTNRSGVFTTTFNCGYQCVPIYSIRAQVTHAPNSPGHATLQIRGSR